MVWLARTYGLILLALAATDPTGSAPATRPEAGGPPGFRPFLPHVAIDRPGRRVRLEGTVVLRQGALELLACLEGTKEHESIIALKGQAKHMHLALLTVGLVPGRPARFEPFEPATGQAVRIGVWWQEEGRWRREDARRWVRPIAHPERGLDVDWVFAGSAFYTDPNTGRRRFLAEGGDVICLVNFADALLDLPFRSSDADADLQFEANTPCLPPEGTAVFLVLEPAGPAATTSAGPTTRPQ